MIQMAESYGYLNILLYFYFRTNLLIYRKNRFGNDEKEEYHVAMVLENL